MAERKRIVAAQVASAKVERLEKDEWNALVRESALQILKNPGATLDIVNDVFVGLYGRTFSPTLIRNLANTSFRYAEIMEGVRKEFTQAWMMAEKKWDIKTHLLTCLTIDEKEKWMLNDILFSQREDLEANIVSNLQKVIEKKATAGDMLVWRESQDQRRVTAGVARDVLEVFGIQQRSPNHVFARTCCEVNFRLQVLHEEDLKKKVIEKKAAEERAEIIRVENAQRAAEIVEKRQQEEAAKLQKLFQKKQRRDARLQAIIKAPRVKLSKGKFAFSVPCKDDLLLLSVRDFGVVVGSDVVYQRTSTGTEEARLFIIDDSSEDKKTSSEVNVKIPKSLEIIWLDGGKQGTIRVQVIPPIYEGKKEIMREIAVTFPVCNYFAFKTENVFLVWEKRGDHLIAIGKYRIATDEEKKAAKTKMAAIILSKGSGKKTPSNVIKISFDGAKSSMADAFRKVAKA